MVTFLLDYTVTNRQNPIKMKYSCEWRKYSKGNVNGKCERHTSFFCIKEALSLSWFQVTFQWWSHVFSFDLLANFDICVSKNLLDKSTWHFYMYSILEQLWVKSHHFLPFPSIQIYSFSCYMNSWPYHPPSHHPRILWSYPRLLCSPMTSNPSPNIVDFSYYLNWSQTLPIFPFLLYAPIWLCHLTPGFLSS